MLPSEVCGPESVRLSVVPDCAATHLAVGCRVTAGAAACTARLAPNQGNDNKGVIAHLAALDSGPPGECVDESIRPCSGCARAASGPRQAPDP